MQLVLLTDRVLAKNWATVCQKTRAGKCVRIQSWKRKVKSVGLREGTVNVDMMTECREEK